MQVASRQISSLKPGPVYCDFVRARNLTVLGASWHQNSREEGRKREEKVMHAWRTMAGRCSWVRCNEGLRKGGGGDSGRTTTQLALGRMEKEGFVFYTLVAHADGQVHFIHSTRSSFIRPNLAYWPRSLRGCY